MYEKGFSSLNQKGYDFFEYFKAVQAAGSDNPATYKMAFTMGKGMDENISKDSLVNQADYYLGKIEETHKSYVQQGQERKNTLTSQKSSEKSKLTTDVGNILQQIEALKAQKEQKESQLAMIDSKYDPQNIRNRL